MEKRLRDLGPCPCGNCAGMLKAIISKDGSAFEAERCDTCGKQWFNDPPLAASFAYEWVTEIAE